MMYLSPSVYEGEKSFYKEEDIAAPVNVYGKTKLAAEQFISEKCSNFAILRSSIIFGPQTISPVPKSLPIQVSSKNVLAKLILPAFDQLMKNKVNLFLLSLLLLAYLIKYFYLKGW